MTMTHRGGVGAAVLAIGAVVTLSGGGPKPGHAPTHRSSPPRMHAPTPPRPHVAPSHGPAIKPPHHVNNNHSGISPTSINAPGFGPAWGSGYHQNSHAHRAHHHYGYYHPNYAMGYRHGYGTSRSPANQAMMRHLRQIQTDLESIPRGAVPDAKYARKLDGDLMASVMNPTRPDPTAVRRLSGDLTSALAARTRPTFNSSILARDLMEVVNVGGLSAAEVRMAITGADGVMHASGATRAGSQAVAADLRLVASGGGPGPNRFR